MNFENEIVKIKKRIEMLHFISIILLVFNIIIWLTALFIYYNNDLVLFIIGFGCILFMIVVIIVGFYIEKRLNKNLKNLVETIAGCVSENNKKTAKDLLRRWKKHYLASMKFSFYDTKSEKYPFGSQIIEDLSQINKGIKIKKRWFYDSLINEDYGEIGNSLINEIINLINYNSYTLDH